METSVYLQFLAALAFVIALIYAIAAVVRRFGMVPGLPRRGLARRLAVVEVQPLDAKRRLVLIRRDDMEHLVLLGVAGDLVIESRIAAPTALSVVDQPVATAPTSVPPVGTPAP
jgi:flagellar protein FliO/FliZ